MVEFISFCRVLCSHVQKELFHVPIEERLKVRLQVELQETLEEEHIGILLYGLVRQKLWWLLTYHLTGWVLRETKLPGFTKPAIADSPVKRWIR